MNKIRGSLYGFIVGDALGVPVEFFNRLSLIRNPIADMINNDNRRTSIGFWSDDTAMTLCTLQSIIDNNGINYLDIMNKFLDWLEKGYMSVNNKCFGIGQTTLKAIINYKRIKQNNEEIKSFSFGPDKGRNSGNGSLMRVLPVVLYLYYNNTDLDITFEIITRVSNLTHCNEDCSLSCLFYCLLIFNLLNKSDLISSIDNTIDQFKCLLNKEKYDGFEKILSKKIIYSKPEEIKSTGYVIDTLEACLYNSTNYKEAVLKAVNLGGDTDTIGAITGSLAGILYGYNNIPEKWVESLMELELIKKIIYDFLKLIKKEQ